MSALKLWHSPETRAKVEANRFAPWRRRPSTHCERRGECASPHGCEAIKPDPIKLEVVTKR